jgi:hypothetical protein
VPQVDDACVHLQQHMMHVCAHLAISAGHVSLTGLQGYTVASYDAVSTETTMFGYQTSN